MKQIMKEVTRNKNFIEGMVSIIVPVYNSKDIRRCIESIVNQSYKNIEIIFINDGSTDNSGEICDNYALWDKRIKVIHKKNNGVASARNDGMQKSKGEFMFFIDADDSIEKGALSLLIKTYDKYKADIIIGNFKIEPSSDKGFLFENNKLLKKEDIVDCVRNYLKKPTGHSPLIYIWGKLFRTTFIKDNDIYFNPDLRVFEDMSFNFQCFKFVNSIYYIKSCIYRYNSSDSLASMEIYNTPLIYKVAFKNIEEFLRSNKIEDKIIEKEIGNTYIHFAIKVMILFFKPNKNIDLKQIHKLISKMVNDSDIRKNLKYYSPSKGNSRILPFLMKLKLVWIIILVCKYKINKKKSSVKNRKTKCKED